MEPARGPRVPVPVGDGVTSSTAARRPVQDSVKPKPKDLRALAARDPLLGAAMARLPRFPGFPRAGVSHYGSHFHALGSAIVHQQLSGKVAKVIHDRVVALTPGPRFPRPDEILTFTDAKLRAASLSRAKVLALKDLARHTTSGALPLARISRLKDQTIIDKLTAVRGIGEWSAQMFLLFRLGRLDIMPTGDLGIREGLRRLDGLEERPTPKELLTRSEPWRPLCSVASWVLWRLADEE